MAEDGTLMLIEPFAGDRVEDNINPIGRLYYAASTTMCCAHAISENGTHVLGAQAGAGQLEAVLKSAGLRHGPPRGRDAVQSDHRGPPLNRSRDAQGAFVALSRSTLPLPKRNPTAMQRAAIHAYRDYCFQLEPFRRSVGSSEGSGMTSDQEFGEHEKALLSPVDMEQIKEAVSALRAASPRSVLADLVEEKIRAMENGYSEGEATF